MATRLTTSCGGRYWQAQWTTQGKRRSKNLGPTATMTRRQAEEELETLIGTHAVRPTTRNAAAGTRLFAWLERYETLRSDLEPGSLDLIRRTATLLRQHFAADPRLDRITPSEAQDFRLWLESMPSRRGAELSAATIGMNLRNTKAMLNAAVRDGLVGGNPFAGVRCGKRAQQQTWAEVTADETERLMEVLPDHAWRAWVGLMRYAGLRSGFRGGEALGLRWDDVDFARHEIRVQDQKRHRQRTVPIQPRLYEILSAALEAATPGEPLVCPIQTSGLDRRLRRYIALAGIDPYARPCHSLRKSLSSDWMSKYPAPAVNAWLGHSAKVAMAHYWQAPAALLSEVTGLKRNDVKRIQKQDRAAQAAEPVETVVEAATA